MKKNGMEEGINQLLKQVKENNINILFLFHVGNISFKPIHLKNIYSLNPNIKIIYDEGDMYGGIAKRINSSMINVLKNVDAVSVRGLGNWYNKCKKYCKRVYYMPHINSLPISKNNFDLPINKNSCFVGNKVQSRLGNLFRLPGAYRREKFVRFLDKSINNLSIFGNGWDNLKNSKGSLKFEDQNDVYKNYTFHFSYEHYPDVPLYWSDRMPISLMRGQIYISHENPLNSLVFKNFNGVYFFNNFQEAIDIYNFLISLNNEKLLELRYDNLKKSQEFFNSINWYNTLIENVLNFD